MDVPNADGLVVSVMGESWYGLPYHLYHFTLKTPWRLLTTAGYRVVSERAVFWPHDVFNVLRQRLHVPGWRSAKLLIAYRVTALLCPLDLSDVMSIRP